MISKKQRAWAERLERLEQQENGDEPLVEAVPVPFAAPEPSASRPFAPSREPKARKRAEEVVDDGAVPEEALGGAPEAGPAAPTKRKGFEFCERCKRAIGGTVKDPVIHTSLGRHCYTCSHKAHAEKALKESEHHATVKARRSEAMKARRVASVEEPKTGDEGELDDDG
jgi:hypothetical protein